MRHTLHYIYLRILPILVALLPISVSATGYFDHLREMPSEERESEALRIYRLEIYPSSMSKHEMLEAVEELRIIAESKNDPKLKIAYHGMRGYILINKSKNLEAGAEEYNQALNIATSTKNIVAQARYTNILGSIYIHSDPRKGFEYLLKSDYLMQQIGYDKIENIDELLSKIAWAYFNYENYPRSLQFLKNILVHSEPNSTKRLYTHAKLGISYEKLLELDSAIYHYEKAREIAKALGDSFAIGAFAGNIGDIYLQKKDYERATPLIEEDVAMSRTHDEKKLSLTTGLLMRASISLHHNKIEDAIRDVNEAGEIMYNLTPYYPLEYHEIWGEYYDLSALIYKKKGDFEKASAYQDSLRLIKDSVAARKDANIIVGVEALILSEKHLADIEILEKEKSRQKVIRNATLAISGMSILLLIGIIYSLMSRQKRQRQKQQILMLEKQKAENQLNAYMNNIKQKNKLLEKFKREVKNLKALSLSGTSEQEDEKGDILQELQEISILTEKDWDHFKNLFDQVHKGFLQKVQQKYPELTLSEMRLMALTKLKLPNKEAANMLGISPKSLSRTSQRLRKKLELNTSDDLEKLVDTI